MAELLLEAGFESAVPWTTSGFATFTPDAARSGAQGVQLLGVLSGFPNPHPVVANVNQTVMVDPDALYTLEVWAMSLSGTGKLRLLVEDTLVAEVDPAAAAAWTLITVTPWASGVGGDVRFRIEAEAVSAWYVDDASFRDATTPEINMATFLSERPVREALLVLQQHLAAQLIALKSARGDALDLPTPDKWYDYQHDEWKAEVCQLEVFETSVVFVQPGRDASDGTSGGSCTSTVTLAIRVAHANRGQSTPSEMVARSRRLTVALRHILYDNPKLAATNDSLHVEPSSMRLLGFDGVFGSDKLRLADRVTFTVQVTQIENRVGEDTPGGAALPALLYPTN